MKHLSVKTQLVIAFGALIAILLLVSLLALHGISGARDRFSEYVEGAAEREALAWRVRAHANRRALAVRDMVLAKTAADRDVARSTAGKSNEELRATLVLLESSAAKASDATERDRTMVAAIKKVEAAYEPVALAILDLAAAEKRDEAIQKMNSECRGLLAALIDSAKDYIEYSEAQAKRAVEVSAAAASLQRNLILVFGALGLVLAFGMGLLMTRRLAAALGAEPAALSDAADRVAHGDLSPVAGASTAPAGSVLTSMGAMQGQLVELIAQVRGSAESIATASAQIAQGNMDLSQRTEQQASALQQTAASMEELGATVKQNAENAKQANQLALSASVVAVKGGDVVGQVVGTMKGINDSSKKIADIISVIDGIAFQTNILALNAAVEAARAGEQGRGFAVVATEVRSLAGRSAEAAKEIKSLITASVERVEQGSALVDQAGATMTEVVNSIKRVTDIMGEISAASSEQSSGVSQVGMAVTQMDRATQQNAALVEESAAAAESLKSQAEHLVRAVAVFKLAPDTARRAALGPVEWRAPGRAPSATRPTPPTRTGKAPKSSKPAESSPATAAAAESAATENWESF